MNGFDRYLEFQFQMTGDFYTTLFRAIQLADEFNLAKLSKGFPEEVEAFKVWSRIGQEAFLDGCSQDFFLVQKVKAGEFIL